MNICPECAAEKCGNCDGTAWDDELDQETRCECKHTARYARRILLALNRTRSHTYAGTVPAKVKARRRARGKVAKASRKANR